MLCEFANHFPRHLAQLLDRDRHLTRNFREETATDFLMMGLTPLQPLGVRVDFPDESVTGADMDWIYAAPHEVGGGIYLRLMIQAKRCKEQKLKGGATYWFYDHLDHGTPKGAQARTLVDYAALSPDGMATVPLYMFYHPEPVLEKASGTLPPVEGINLRLATDVAGTVDGGCKRSEKKVDFWRAGFMTLSDLLCWPMVESHVPPAPDSTSNTEILTSAGSEEPVYPTVAWHPELVAERMNLSRYEDDDFPVRPSSGIPEGIRRAIAGETAEKDRATLERPRVILSTSLTRESPSFERARAAVQRRRQ